jgi:peptide/nickel transport system permease protein
MAASIRRSRISRISESFKIAISEIWRQTPGKAALVLFILLVAMAVIAVVTITPDFLVKWESASYWEDNPVVVPPCWVNSLGYKTAKTAQIYFTTPSSMEVSESEVRYIYTYNYTLDVNEAPKDLYVKAEVPLLCEEGVFKAPTIRVTVERPDGIVVLAWDMVIEPGKTGENVTLTCGSLLSAKTSKETFRLAEVTSAIMDKYNITVPTEIAGTNETYVITANSIMRTTIRTELENKYLTILSVFVKPISYKISLNRNTTTLEVFSKQINNLKTTFLDLGINIVLRDKIIEALDYAANNITWVINNINTVTYTDYLIAMNNAYENLNNVNKLALAASAPVDVRSSVDDLTKTLGKFIEVATTTPSLIQPEIVFDVLQGDYRVNVTITYYGVKNPPRALSAKIGIIVKGGCYGILGTADKGVDIATVVLYGTPIALAIGFATAVASVFIGVIAGIVSGYYGGFIDEAIQRTVDVLGNIPLLPILIIVGSVAQRTFTGEAKSLYIILTYIGILIIFGWGGTAITVRAMTLSIKEEPYIEAAKALGASNTRIIFKHILPQVLIYAAAVLVFNVPGAIITEAGLSVLGLRHGWPTWGSVLSSARAENRFDVWWWILPPGLMLSLTSLTFVLLGLAIERIVEPRLRTL